MIDEQQSTNQISSDPIRSLKIVIIQVVLCKDLGATSQRLFAGEAQVVGVANVADHTIVACEDDTGAVTALVWHVAAMVWALHQNHVTEIITTVTVHQNVVLSLRVSHTLNGVGESIGLSVSALNLNRRTCQEYAKF